MYRLLKVFSQDASFPPSGPIMIPRYSEAPRMLKEVYVGAVWAKYILLFLGLERALEFCHGE